MGRLPWKRKGHIQLGVRSVTCICQCILSLSLALRGVDSFHMYGLALCQLTASVSYFTQCMTALDAMFAVRAFSSFVRVCVGLHLAACGRVWARDDRCWSRPWHRRDARDVFRALHVVAAVRQVLNGRSLLRQYFTPSLRSTAFRGHDELHRRGCIRASGVPLHFARGLLKILLLRGTQYERTDHEIVVNFLRALVFVPIGAWSLRRQWLTPPKREFASSAAAKDDVDAAPAHLAHKDFDIFGRESPLFRLSSRNDPPSFSSVGSNATIADRVAAAAFEEVQHELDTSRASVDVSNGRFSRDDARESVFTSIDGPPPSDDGRASSFAVVTGAVLRGSLGDAGTSSSEGVDATRPGAPPPRRTTPEDDDDDDTNDYYEIYLDDIATPSDRTRFVTAQLELTPRL
mmetsp:Transcript_20135/g.62270  ORF Transcript_20135/g.62270 Transcript_20135/m.62270 type:complete len:403 (-) Transcript_20135:170-1378(-)